MELKIDKELEELFPPLSDEEFSLLEENILKEGCIEKLTVWNGTLVDGHNRYKICKNHNLPFEIREKEFTDKDEAIVWMIDNQKGRRNMSIPTKIEMALKREGSIRAMAKKNQEGFKGNQYTSGVLAHGPKDQKPINTLKELADFAGTSPKTVQRFKKVKDSGDEELYKEVMLGPEKGGKSIRAGYDEVMKKTRTEKPEDKPGNELPKTEEEKEMEQIKVIKEFAAQLKKPSPVSGDGSKIQYVDPIITDLTEKIKNFINEVAEYQYISERVSPELNSLIKSAIERLQNINSKIKEK